VANRKYYVFNKPYNVLSQFTRENDSESIADYFFLDDKDVYPVGRLDRDSEGLLILTNDKRLNNLLLSPKNLKTKVYFAQVEGRFSMKASKEIKNGVRITIDKKPYNTLPARAQQVDQPQFVWERVPPVRYRKEIPTSWVKIEIQEGKNRQVRKMLAAVGFPVLRLIRTRIEDLDLNRIEPGDIQVYHEQEMYRKLRIQ